MDSQTSQTDNEPSLADIYKEILRNRQEITASNKSLASLADATKECINAYSQVNSRLTDVERRIEEHTNQIAALGRNERRNNLIVRNVPDEPRETRPKLAQKLVTIFREVEIDIDLNSINDCYRIGQSTTSRPVVLKLVSCLAKDAILLKKEELSRNGYSVKHDRSPEDRAFYNTVKPYLDELHRRNKRAFLKYGKIIVDNNAYSVDEIKNMLSTTSEQTDPSTGGKRKYEDASDTIRAKLKKYAFERKSSVASGSSSIADLSPANFSSLEQPIVVSGTSGTDLAALPTDVNNEETSE